MKKEIIKRDNGSKRVLLHTNGTSKVQQHLKEECDLDKMLEKYKRTGQIKVRQNPMFEDFSNLSSFHEAQNALIAAKNAFLEVPAKVRQRFDNDPQKMIDFLADQKNLAEAIDLGLIEEKAVKAYKEQQRKKILKETEAAQKAKEAAQEAQKS